MTFVFSLETPVEKVFDTLLDPDKFVQVHPLIYQMDTIGDNHYLIYEKVRFGILSYKFRYKAEIIGNSLGDRVSIEARIAGLTHISLVFQLSQAEGRTQVTETAQVRTVLPIKKMMYSLLQEQHQIMFSNMDKG